jgi:hypothetical protein
VQGLLLALLENRKIADVANEVGTSKPAEV